MTKDANRKCEVQVNIVKRADGKYSVTVNSPGRSEKITGCDWPEAERMLKKVKPKEAGTGVQSGGVIGDQGFLVRQHALQSQQQQFNAATQNPYLSGMAQQINCQCSNTACKQFGCLIASGRGK